MQKTFELVSQDRESKARRGRLITTHGVIDTPVFMPIGTPIAVVTKEYFMSELVFFLRLLVSNALSGKNRGKIFPGRRRETECSDGLDRRSQCRVARDRIAG